MLNYEEIKEDPQRIANIESFIEKYNWERIDFPSQRHDWNKLK